MQISTCVTVKHSQLGKLYRWSKHVKMRKTDTHTDTRMHAHMHTRTHARTHSRTHARTHTHTHTQHTPVTAMAIVVPPEMFPFLFSAGVLNGRMAFNSTPSLLPSSLSKFWNSFLQDKSFFRTGCFAHGRLPLLCKLYERERGGDVFVVMGHVHSLWVSHQQMTATMIITAKPTASAAIIILTTTPILNPVGIYTYRLLWNW